MTFDEWWVRFGEGIYTTNEQSAYEAWQAATKAEYERITNRMLDLADEWDDEAEAYGISLAVAMIGKEMK